MFEQLSEKLDAVLRNIRGLGKISDKNIRDTSRQIRRVLLEADVHFEVARDFIKRVETKALGVTVTQSVKPGYQFVKILRDEMSSLLGSKSSGITFAKKPPTVILMAGLQGSGKTTTCSKLAKKINDEGKSVMLVAADIYRPAAIDQLKILGKQINIPVYSEGHKDPVKICESAIKEAVAEKIQVVILDTAGRLHVDGEMMQEIEMISAKVNPDETLFVADGMTGQDAVISAKAFSEALQLTGTILTKMDGDARGGAAVSISEVTGVPVKFMGVSEKMDGLEAFDPKRVADRIRGMGDVVSLVEKAEKVMDAKQAEKLEEKLKKQSFTLDDYKEQLNQMKNMGPLSQLVGMMPGMNKKMLKGLNLDDRQLIWTEAIINSMTQNERNNPSIIDGSCRSRIAQGSGRTVQEVNQLIKQYFALQKMMKKMGKMKLPAGLNYPIMGAH
jgi:signal recognition particle subunit SRP54